MGRRKALIIGLVACVMAVFAGRWSKSLFTTAEFVHFSVNFPTVAGDPQMTLEDFGGPWARLPASDWDGYPAGGILVWGREGEIEIDLGRQGWIKRLVQPRSVLLSTHWLRNVGTAPETVSLELDMCGFDTRWITFERFWDPETRTLRREIAPAGLANMDWEITVPETRMGQSLICQGTLTVMRAHAGDVLTVLPIKIVNSRMGGDA